MALCSQPGPKTKPARHEHNTWLAGPQIWLAASAGPQAWLAWLQSWLARSPAWVDDPDGGLTSNVRIFKQTENLPALKTLFPIGAAAKKWKCRKQIYIQKDQEYGMQIGSTGLQKKG